MNDLTKILTASLLACAVAVALPGCGESTGPSPSDTHSAGDGHDHGHDHAEGEHDDHDGYEHGALRSLGTVTIAGSTLAVSVSSKIEPSSQVQLDLEVQSGPIPTAIRFWIGDESGTGALKARADAHDNHFHGQTEAPATLGGASLWIEIETAGGERQTAPVSLE